jgi:hypothetical protein
MRLLFGYMFVVICVLVIDRDIYFDCSTSVGVGGRVVLVGYRAPALCRDEVEVWSLDIAW